MKIKSIAAAIALSAVSFSANAAFDIDGADVGPGGGNGSGSVVLTVLNVDGSNQTSMSIDLGLTVSDFLNNSVAANTDLLSGAEETSLVNFLGASNGAISWDVVGIVNNGSSFDIGFLTTTNGAPGSFNDNDISSNFATMASWMDATGGNASGNVSTFADATLPGGGADSNHNISFVPQIGGLGDELSFDAFLRGFGPGGDGSAFNALANTFTLSTDGTALTYNASAAVIPLPAAAWVFISAVIGLAGVARRRNSLPVAAA